MNRGKLDSPPLIYRSRHGANCLRLPRNSAGPEGTVADEDSAKRNPDYIAHFQPTYKVEPWGYCKRVTDTDAVALSRALTATFIAIKAGDIAPLQAQSQVLIRDGMTKEEFESINLNANDSLRDFAEFTSKGGFVFAWDD